MGIAIVSLQFPTSCKQFKHHWILCVTTPRGASWVPLPTVFGSSQLISQLMVKREIRYGSLFPTSFPASFSPLCLSTFFHIYIKFFLPNSALPDHRKTLAPSHFPNLMQSLSFSTYTPRLPDITFIVLSLLT